MKNINLILILLLFSLLSCQTEPVTPTDDPIPADCIVNLNDYQPMNLTTRSPVESNGADVSKLITFHPSTGTFGVIVNPDACAGFDPPLQMIIEGGGIATHLGQFEVLNTACVTPEGDFLSPVYGFITAANGDVIHTQMGAPYPDFENPPNFYYPYYIIGGSDGGRFEDATGYINMYGIVDYENGVWSLSGEGEITY